MGSIPFDIIPCSRAQVVIVDVRAIILVGGCRVEGSERLGNVPIGLLDVLGEPILQRVINRLEKFGISGTAVVTEVSPSAAFLAPGSVHPARWMEGSGTQFWRSVETAFNDFAQNGAELVLVIRVGAYAELDYEELVQYHLDAGCRVTSVVDSEGEPLDTFVISASRRNDAAYLFRHELQEMRVPCENFRFSGYVNKLRDARDLRLLALDGFSGIAQLPPRGTELKPGVWIGEGARVHKSARLLAPCFIGANSRVRATAVMTRGSVAEHHSHIDCGTVVENASILSSTVLGAGLDVAYSVVGFRRIWNLRRAVEVEITDSQLVGQLRSAPLRMLGDAAQVAITLVSSLTPRFFRRNKERTGVPDASCPSSEHAPEDNLGATDLLSARRYGNE
ncbi:MAG TPA: hypothetical protein VF135_13130 [Terriglobales bacterium]